LRTTRKKHPLCESGWWRSSTAGSGGLVTRRDLDLVSEGGALPEAVAGSGLFALNERRLTGGPREYGTEKVDNAQLTKTE
jgi:hypothetical protein